MTTKNKVTIFSNGMAHFRRFHKGTEQSHKIELPVKQKHIGDILLSLLIEGKAKIISPPSFTPENEASGKLQLDGKNTFQELAHKLRGAEAEIEYVANAKTKDTGRIFGLDSEKVLGGGESIDRYYLQLLTTEGLIRIPQHDIKNIRFTQEVVQSEIDKALKRAFQTIKPESTTVSLELKGEGDIFVNYTIPAAAWKMTYRLRTGGKSVLLDGVCVIDNNTEEDWNDFLVSVVTGEPISFGTDVATSKSPIRTIVNLVNDVAQGAVTPERGYTAAVKSSRGMLRAASAQPMTAMAFSAAGHSESMDYDSGEIVESCLGGGIEANATVAEVGDFSIFEIQDPVSIKAGQSAEITVLNAELQDASVILFYKVADNAERPFRAIKFKNGTGQNLGKGACTVYEKHIYGGSAILQATKKDEGAILCHAIETGVRIRHTPGNQTAEQTSVKIANGVAVQVTESVCDSEYRIKNIKNEEFKLVLDHANVWTGKQAKIHGLLGDSELEASESLKNGTRFNITLPANQEVTFYVHERFVQRQQITITSHWITNAVVRAEHPILHDPAIKAIVELQQVYEKLQLEHAAKKERMEVVEEEQRRVQELLKSDNNESWRADLRSTETEIRKISREELPAIKKKMEDQQAKINAALKQLACGWEREDKKEEKKSKKK